MQVRAGGHAGRADISDDLALLDFASRSHAGSETADMRIGAGVTVGVLDAHVIAVAAFGAGEFDDAVTGGIDRRSGRRGKILAAVHFRITENRMVTHAESRGDARTVDRRA